jgi:hypothetical protein
MQRIFALIALIVIFGGGIYYYVNYRNTQNPVKVYEKALAIPGVEGAKTFVTEKIKNWKPDPEDPQITYPKNWGQSMVTVDGYTFKVISPDSVVPPRYYVSFEYPKPLVAKTNLIKCWGTVKEKKTDVCMVGNNPVVDAYFNLMKFFKK